MTGSESAKYNEVQQKGYIIDLEVTEQMAQLFEEMESVLYSISFDDSNEEGSGQKLLSLLQKMSVENIMIVVYLWHNRMPGGNSCEVYRNVLERAKDLITTLHTKVIEAESMLQKRIEEQHK